ncbi:hypothetical protein [Nocardia huaxiensis]|uniref:hypothetical protein n=1 Tax=Nocardia huaxiensis TaxID=2755382 RepID=UPI001E41E102|nr:hypothetical protein [Nocardia huaxiensis]UFS99098.1 hypothetical protein LPY97_14965 [Nocardia huaxiensis]
MSHNGNDPILPVPSDLYNDIGGIEDRVRQLRRDIRVIRNQYAELRQSPDALRVDELGEPIAPTDAIGSAEHALQWAEYHLQDTSEAIDSAHQSASRLSLTEAACEHREQQLEQRQTLIQRSR